MIRGHVTEPCPSVVKASLCSANLCKKGTKTKSKSWTPRPTNCQWKNIRRLWGCSGCEGPSKTERVLHSRPKSGGRLCHLLCNIIKKRNTKISKYKYARGRLCHLFWIIIEDAYNKNVWTFHKNFFLTIETFVCYTDDRSETSLTYLFPCKPKYYPYV